VRRWCREWRYRKQAAWWRLAVKRMVGMWGGRGEGRVGVVTMVWAVV
jgi:hypothetical protein